MNGVKQVFNTKEYTFLIFGDGPVEYELSPSDIHSIDGDCLYLKRPISYLGDDLEGGLAEHESTELQIVTEEQDFSGIYALAIIK